MLKKQIFNCGYISKEIVYSNNKLYSVCYKRKDLFHREGDKPAQIWYSDNRREYEFYYINDKLYKIDAIKKGLISWDYIYKYKKYDIEFLVKYTKQIRKYMSREDKIKVIEYKMRFNNV